DCGPLGLVHLGRIDRTLVVERVVADVPDLQHRGVDPLLHRCADIEGGGLGERPGGEQREGSRSEENGRPDHANLFMSDRTNAALIVLKRPRGLCAYSAASSSACSRSASWRFHISA